MSPCLLLSYMNTWVAHKSGWGWEWRLLKAPEETWYIFPSISLVDYLGGTLYNLVNFLKIVFRLMLICGVEFKIQMNIQDKTWEGR